MSLPASNIMLVPSTKSCLICSGTITDFPVNFKENQKVCKLFCPLACRYLNFNCGDEIKAERTITVNIDVKQDGDINLLCDSCFPLAESFCEIYHNFKQLELLFHWRMKEFIDLIRVRMEKGIGLDETKDFKFASTEERIRGWRNFRKKFVNRGNQNFVANDIPKLQLSKLKLDTKMRENVKGTGNFNDNANISENHRTTAERPEIVLNDSRCEILKSPTCEKQYTGVQKCTMCNKAFYSAYNLARHQKSKGHSNAVVGTVANSTTINNRKPQQASLQQKILKKSSTFDCNMCDKSFTNKNNLRIHQRVHSGDRPYKCRVCGKAFTTPGNRCVHERLHSDVKPYKCAICGQKFRHTQALNIHGKAKHHGEDFRGPQKKTFFECSLCEKVFGKLSHKILHEKSHSNERPYKCKFCVRRFRLMARCEIHQKTCNFNPDFKRIESHINQSTSDDSKLKICITDNNEIDEGVTRLVKVDVSCSSGVKSEEILQDGDFILPD